MSVPRLNILFIDDHPLIRRGFGSFLADTGRFTIAGEASSLAEARNLLESMEQAPDLILLDISLGQENGLDFLEFLNTREDSEKKPAVLVYSMFEDPFRVQNALALGARGYVAKSAKETELLKAIDTILAGNCYVGSDLQVKIHETPNFYNILSGREREVLSLVKQQYDNRRIAETLKISLRTVENHLSHIYLKTGLNSRDDLLKL
jgi:NarL family two-component system response regulator LiaR